jgi:hypothetical protein
MIFRRTVDWASLRLFCLFFLLFFGAFLVLRFAILRPVDLSAIDQADLVGTALFALFFARLTERTRTRRGRMVLVVAILVGPPLVLLVADAVSAAWTAWLAFIGG